MNAQYDEGIGILGFPSSLICNQIGGVKELASLMQSATSDVGWAWVRARHVRSSVHADAG